ncbi:MAG: biotin/lipoate A/B protein ligase family protein, partial [Syntrophales bacterium]|nr:biotin/lipoate A/B protein ligase family protein [Syntrophales bacterium]
RTHRQKGEPPVLRFYGWERPAVSIGYFQNAEEEIDCAYCRGKGIDIVRRPTGGKAVLHGNDLTYSLVAGESVPPFSPDVVETYRIISGCIIRGLSKAGIEVQIVEEGRGGAGSTEGFCFATSYKNELLAGGRKICGSAQMRARGVFLQHGSVLIDLDPLAVCAAIGKTKDAARAQKIEAAVTSVRETMGGDISMDDLCRDIAAGFEEVLNIRLVESELSPEEEALKDRLLDDKYMRDEWNMKGRGAGSGY